MLKYVSALFGFKHAHACHLVTSGRSLLSDAAQAKDATQLQSAHGVSRGLGDGLQRAPLTHRLRQVSNTHETLSQQHLIEASFENNKVVSVGGGACDLLRLVH